MERKGSIEYIYPHLDSDDRQATLSSAVFSLISTIIGGGVLSLPYAFSRAGILLGLLFLGVVALISDFSVYILISSSRRSGGVSYEQVAKRAFGWWAQILTMILLFLLTFLCCVAYLILMGDLFTPITEVISGLDLGPLGRRIVMVGILGVVFPFCMFDSLNSLRFTSFLSIVAMGVLTCCIALRSIQRLWEPQDLEKMGYDVKNEPLTPLLWWNLNWHDAVFAFPIISVAYLCHFNVLPLHQELVQPTRPRIKSMIHWVMGLCSVIYCLIGVLGYVYARKETDGNILNNFEVGDGVMNVGRFGLGLTLCLSFPLLVLPARHQAYRLWNVIFVDPFTVEFKKEKSDLYEQLNPYTGLSYIDNKVQSNHYGSFVAEEQEEEEDLEGPGTFFKIVSTTFICGAALVLACLVPSVATVWSVTGSTVSIIIAYILPAACYLKIRRSKRRNRLKIWVWILLLSGIGSLILCTYQSISSVIAQSVDVAGP